MISSTLIDYKGLAGTAVPLAEERINFCRWENLGQKKCPYCFSFVVRYEGEVKCTSEKCKFKKSPEQILEGINDRYNKFSHHLDNKEKGHIRSTLRELKIHI